MTLRALLILLFALSIRVNAQSIRNLVLEGAGVRGLAYAGAVKALEEKSMLDSVRNVGGTSAGAIAALAICLGYSGNELEQLIFETKLQKFNDGQFIFFGGLARLNKRFGWYRGHAFDRWLGRVIQAKTGNENITFQQLHDRNFKDLFVTGTSLNAQRVITFSDKSYPNMKVRDAVRISMNIPLYFEAVFIDAKGNVLSKKKSGEAHDIMVDGGLTANFPITMFDSPLSPDMKTVGLRIDTPEQIGADTTGTGLAALPISSFRNFVACLL